MSATAFSAGAQTVAVDGYASGDNLAAILLSALALNARFLMLGMTLSPQLPQGRLRRSASMLVLTDAAWVLSRRMASGPASRNAVLVAAGTTSLVSWVLGTLVGSVGAQMTGIDPAVIGLDVVLPALFVWLVCSLPHRDAAVSVAIGALSFVLTASVAPPVYAVLVAGFLGALRGLRR
jgi:predicted branched-subunit amino acid permease